VLFPKTDLCRSTGIELNGATVAIVAEKGEVATALAERLSALHVQAHIVQGAEAAAKIAELVRSGALTGVYFIPGLEADPNFEVIEPADWSAACAARVETLYQVAKAIPETAFLMSATRQGGLHGFQNPANPLGGLVSGFTKALRRERPEQIAKVVDFHTTAAAAVVGTGQPLLADEARPGRRHETAAPDPVHRLRPGRRDRRRPRSVERVDAERHRRDDPLGGRVPGTVGPLRPGPDLR
jgi:hypothetical protein